MHTSSLPSLADFPASLRLDGGEAAKAAMEDELHAVGNKYSPVITRHGQRSSLDITLQSPHGVTSQLIFRQSVGSASLCEQLSVGAIVSGLAAGI